MIVGGKPHIATGISIPMVDRKGIACGGNFIVDRVKEVDVYPEAGCLANISSERKGTGGSAYNVLVDLARGFRCRNSASGMNVEVVSGGDEGAPGCNDTAVDLPLHAFGCVGADEEGRGILKHLDGLGVGRKGMRTVKGIPTSYTDVYSEPGGARRTFFHHRGANARFHGDKVDPATLTARIFHLGYLLLLDALDEPFEDGRTHAALLLDRLRMAGMETSVDLVSEDSDRFARVVTPSLPYMDYLFMNEFEAARILDRQVQDRGEVAAAARDIQARGPRNVIIHTPEVAVWAQRNGTIQMPSFRIPQGFIKGSVGAGDAFAAGCLFGIHEGYPHDQVLMLGHLVACASLTALSCTEGIHGLEGLLDLAHMLGAKTLEDRLSSLLR